MRKRTQAREYALTILYQVEVAHFAHEEAISSFWNEREEGQASPEVAGFASDLVRGVAVHQEEIDQKISKHATNWQIDRMAVLDRNILRIGCFEILFREDIPPKVAINEAVDLAKKYSGEEAGKFVNAILDKVKIEIGK